MEIKKGMKFKAAADSETPDMEFEVIETGLTVDGFNGCKSIFSDGETEKGANAVLQQAVEINGLTVIY